VKSYELRFIRHGSLDRSYLYGRNENHRPKEIFEQERLHAEFKANEFSAILSAEDQFRTLQERGLELSHLEIKKAAARISPCSSLCTGQYVISYPVD
jgi:hypothetical protein